MTTHSALGLAQVAPSKESFISGLRSARDRSTGSGTTCDGLQGSRFQDKAQRCAVEQRKLENMSLP